jgi:5-formyltetrahydrofolate cyclo-ligase
VTVLIHDQKRALRHSARQRLASAPMSARAEWSAAACARLLETPGFSRARTIMGYMPLPEELDLWPLFDAAFAAGKRVCLPRIDWAARTMAPMVIDSRNFEREVREHGLEEPAAGPILPIESLDLILIPGLAFDATGNRIGRGAGFYDRFLSTFRRVRRQGAAAIGIAFELQIVDRVPTEAHDALLDGLVTERRLVLCRTEADPADTYPHRR